MGEDASRCDEQLMSMPVVDLAKDRTQVIAEMRDASDKWGFFQIVNHGIPESAMEGVIHNARLFHEQDDQVKQRYSGEKIVYNPKAFGLGGASWRNTLYAQLAPDPPKLEEYPDVCRDMMIEYAACIKKLGKSVLELLSEALGLNPNHLYETMGCAQGLLIQYHYYKACPESKPGSETLGLVGHTDSGTLTILLTDQIGGLQVLRANQWIDVPYLPGALIVNIGDALQIFSNDKFKSVFHRVVAKSSGPRVSIGGFFQVKDLEKIIYEPIHELLSDENPPVYGQISLKDLQSQRLNHGSGILIPRLQHFKLNKSTPP